MQAKPPVKSSFLINMSLTSNLLNSKLQIVILNNRNLYVRKTAQKQNFFNFYSEYSWYGKTLCYDFESEKKSLFSTRIERDL